MKTLKEFIKGGEHHYSAFLISRANMPQIDNIDDFINFVDHQRVSNIRYIGTVNGFNPTQTDFVKHKVYNIQMEFRKEPDKIKSMKPIIVSGEDGFVLDGHHRYYASLNTNTPIPILRVDLTINKLLKLAQEYKERTSG